MYATSLALVTGSLAPMALQVAVNNKSVFKPLPIVVVGLIFVAVVTFCLAAAEDFRCFSYESLLWDVDKARSKKGVDP